MSRVLIVDDEKDILEIISDLLSTKLLYQVDTANNGLEGFIKAQQNKYDLIISDHKMPFMLGSALVTALRFYENKNKETPIIFLSAFSSDELKSSLNIPFLHFMEKPINSEKFIKYIRDNFL